MSHIDADHLVSKWRKRRREILKTLKPEFRAEYRRLGMLISATIAEQSDSSPIGIKQKGLLDLPRIPLLIQKQKLIEYLRNRESASRAEIRYDTKIPDGSLSSLLRSDEFKNVSHGIWCLNKVV